MGKAMRKKVLLLTVVCALFGFGCNRAKQTVTTTGSSPTAPFGKADVEAKLKQKLNLKEIRLEESEKEGEYTGNATGQDGTKYKMKATYQGNVLKWEYEDQTGAKGSGSEGPGYLPRGR